MTIFDKAEKWLDELLAEIKNWIMNIITINGKRIECSGRNIKVVDDKVFVDGKLMEGNLSGTVKIQFEGDLANLDCTSAEVNGNVQGNVDCTSIRCGDVAGDIDATSVRCKNVKGDIDAVSVKRKK